MATFVTVPGLLLFYSRTDVTSGGHSSRSFDSSLQEGSGQSTSSPAFRSDGVESLTHTQGSTSEASRSGAPLNTDQANDTIDIQRSSASSHQQQPLNMFSLAAQHFAETVSLLHSRHLQSRERRRPMAVLQVSKSSRNPQSKASARTPIVEPIPDLPSSLARLAFRDSTPHLLSRTNGLFRWALTTMVVGVCMFTYIYICTKRPACRSLQIQFF